MLTSSSRARLAVSAAVTAGLCLTGTAALTSPTHAATGVCDTAYPVADLTPDQVVHGLTVTSGTTPSTFDGSIIGVLKDGIEPGVDMVMARLTSPTISEAGIWAGMSGSPVYAENGDLIGAVAYTLSFGQSSIAGITPWEDMQAWAGHPAPTKVQIPSATAKRIAAKTAVSQAQAAQGFHELKAPALVSGLSQRVLDRATGRPYLTKGATAAGQAADSPNAADIVAGGNLVATASTGDIVQGGLGTVTSVCNDRVVGFGHPMDFTGRTTLGLAGADTLFIQPDPVFGSFKVANIGGVVGTIDQDRATGISGMLNALPPSIDITSTVNYTPTEGTPRSRTGSSQVQVPEASADTAFLELLANHQSVLDAFQPGSEDQSWTITGHTADGPFTLSSSNLYTDRSDITFGSVFDLPDLLWLLHNIDGVTVDSANVTSDVDDSTDLLKIGGLQQRVGGQWVEVGKGHPAQGRAGHDLTLRLTFKNGTTGHAFSFHLPKSSAGMRTRLASFGGAQSFPFERHRPKTLAGVKKLVHSMTRNDQAQVILFGFDGHHFIQLEKSTAPEGTVIGGRGSFRVVIS